MLHIIYLIAISAEAGSGALMAMRRKMDVFGVALVGTVTALGGGSVRDMLLGHFPLGWVQHPEYLLFTVGAALAAATAAQVLQRLKSAFLLLDALGLVAFSIIGCDVAAAAGVHVAVVVLMGMITGTAGGLLRDIVCNQVPLVLRRDLYATVALATGALYMAQLHYGVGRDVATLFALAAGFGLRLAALRMALALPVPGRGRPGALDAAGGEG
ncbi:trimeric intracellular cation channel family protein [Massilia sp. MS-15]|uniref:trimeric intracellular cation channel family protein n=1 Tax=Massilia sp. MS-15 TaxID=2878200 RepID=UPI001CD5C71F|nr:trimeric intracellular cation channel family protein [Massilia sp. MS-15]MCA1245685.1 trimeric intracellular cation channel family protein [Massilia sp. MS-15]